MIPDWMIIGAFRYCLGRMTYIVSDCTEWLIDNKNDIDRCTREIIVKEINDALDRDRAGMDMDRRRWRVVLKVFK